VPIDVLLADDIGGAFGDEPGFVILRIRSSTIVIASRLKQRTVPRRTARSGITL
jgi:hypothetical protein